MLVRGLVFLLVYLPCAQELLDVLEDPTAMAALRGILQEILARKGIDSCPEGNSLLKLHRLKTRCSRQGQEIRALTARASELLRATLPSNLPFLSDSIMLHIARHLDVRSLGRLAIVEKRLMKIVNEAARLHMAKLCPSSSGGSTGRGRKPQRQLKKFYIFKLLLDSRCGAHRLLGNKRSTTEDR